MKKTALGVAMLALASSVAMGDTSLSINIEIGDAVLNTVAYDCGPGGALQVDYISSDTDAFALAPMDGDDRIFVNVVAASGHF